MVPQALKDRPQWLVWRFVQKEEGKKPQKMPFYTSGRVRGKLKGATVQIEQGSDEDRALLVTFDEAMRVKSTKRYDGVGFAFLPGDGLIGIDLDGAVVPEPDESSGEIKRHLMSGAQKILAACQSFAEYSPSGKGLHIYARGSTETFKSDAIGVEVFCGSQFFTVTGEHVPGTPELVNDLSPQALELLRGLVDEAKRRKREERDAERAAKGLSAPARPAAIAQQAPAGENDFQRVNSAAMGSLDGWVMALFPGAIRSGGGYRVSSKSLGRDLQEDLSIHQEGIVDWGVNDMGDAREGRRTPIDLVMEWSPNKAPKDALRWLASQLGVTLSTPGSRDSRKAKPSGAGSSRAPAAAAGGGEGPPPDDGYDVPADDDDDIGPFDPEGLPLIEVKAGHLPECVDRAEAVLLKSGIEIYQRDRMLVRVVRRSVPSVRNYKRPAGALGITTVELTYLVEQFTRMAHWQRWDPRKTPKNAEAGEKGDWVRINAPDKVAATYMARGGEWRVPELWSVITAPTLRPDGTILQKPGYDEAMKSWYDPCGIEFPEIPDQPTREQALVALEKLKKAFSTFPFVEDVDRSVTLALALCALVRRSLPSAPLGAITAPVMSSGKTLLADLISILATGAKAPVMTYTEQEEEFKKTLLAVLMEGDQVVLMDNVTHPLQGDTLCSVLTSETYTQRMLGRTEMVKAPTTTQILANGNQLVIAGDLRTRALLCRLDAGCEHPEEREFKVSARDWFLERRPELVAAALTVMRAYVVGGKKNAARNGAAAEAPLVKPFGRFEDWSEMVRAPLVWLGEPDPCASVKALEKDDPARNELRQVLHAWRSLYQTDGKKASDICKEMSAVGGAFNVTADERALEEALREFAQDREGRWSARRLAKWLARHAGRRADGLMLVKGEEKDHTQLWRVDEVADE